MNFLEKNVRRGRIYQSLHSGRMRNKHKMRNAKTGRKGMIGFFIITVVLSHINRRICIDTGVEWSIIIVAVNQLPDLNVIQIVLFA